VIGFLLNCSRVRPKSITYKTDFHLQSRSGNRIPWLKVGVSMVVEPNVKVTVKRLDYFIGITYREWSFGSNWRVKVEREQLWCDRNILGFSDGDRVFARFDWNLLSATDWKHMDRPIDTRKSTKDESLHDNPLSMKKQIYTNMFMLNRFLMAIWYERNQCI